MRRDELLRVLRAVHVRPVVARIGQAEHVLQRAHERDVAVGVAVRRCPSARRAGSSGCRRCSCRGPCCRWCTARRSGRSTALPSASLTSGPCTVPLPVRPGLPAGFQPQQELKPVVAVAFVEHDDDRHALLRVRPDRRRLDLLDQVVGVDVAAVDVLAAAVAVAGRARRARAVDRARDRRAVHVVALIGLEEVQVADVAASADPCRTDRRPSRPASSGCARSASSHWPPPIVRLLRDEIPFACGRPGS